MSGKSATGGGERGGCRLMAIVLIYSIFLVSPFLPKIKFIKKTFKGKERTTKKSPILWPFTQDPSL